jgi:glycerol-3-phosphate acyltransferase PlsX
MTIESKGAPRDLIRIALDAMGGDFAPAETVKGAVQAARTQPVSLLVVGDRDVVEAELAKEDTAGLAIEVIPSKGKIEEDEHPVRALRHKPESSVAVATHLLKQGEADALVSMGSTGATMAGASLILGTLGGLDRPCLGGPFLGLAPRTVVVDMGSNVDCRPALLLGFASMGCVFAHRFLGVEDPRVGLLSTGAEEAKGNRQVLEASDMFRDSGLNFVGHVEGMDFFTGKADVIVCDGFVGNVLMKFTEGLGATMAGYLRTLLDGKLPANELDGFVSRVWEVNNLPKRMGGPLFGVNGAVVIGHGASRGDSVAGAIDTARRCVELDLVDGMRTELEALLSEAPSPD